MKKITVDSKWIVLVLRLVASASLLMWIDMSLSISSGSATIGLLASMAVIALAVWSSPKRRVVRWLASLLLSLMFVSITLVAVGGSDVTLEAESDGDSGLVYVASACQIFVTFSAIWLPTKYGRRGDVK